MSALTSCSQCKKQFNYDLNTKRIPIDILGIVEVGIHCPFCGYWVRAYFTNAELEKLRDTYAKVRQNLFRAVRVKAEIASKHDELQKTHSHRPRTRIVENA